VPRNVFLGGFPVGVGGLPLGGLVSRRLSLGGVPLGGVPLGLAPLACMVGGGGRCVFLPFFLFFSSSAASWVSSCAFK
jgi:hypothetical protein